MICPFQAQGLCISIGCFNGVKTSFHGVGYTWLALYIHCLAPATIGNSFAREPNSSSPEAVRCLPFFQNHEMTLHETKRTFPTQKRASIKGATQVCFIHPTTFPCGLSVQNLHIEVRWANYTASSCQHDDMTICLWSQTMAPPGAISSRTE